jgi:hypothetical protein
MFKASAFALRAIVNYVRDNKYYRLNYTSGTLGEEKYESHRFTADDYSMDIFVLQIGADTFVVQVDEGMKNDIEIKCDRAQAKFVVNALKHISKSWHLHAF